MNMNVSSSMSIVINMSVRVIKIISGKTNIEGKYPFV